METNKIVYILMCNEEKKLGAFVVGVYDSGEKALDEKERRSNTGGFYYIQIFTVK